VVHNYRRCSCASGRRSVSLRASVFECQKLWLPKWACAIAPRILWENVRKWVGIIATGHRPHQRQRPRGEELFTSSERDGNREIVHLSTRDSNLTILSTLAAFVFLISSETWKRQMNYEWPGMTNYSGPLQMGQKPLIRRTRGTENNKNQNTRVLKTHKWDF